MADIRTGRPKAAADDCGCLLDLTLFAVAALWLRPRSLFTVAVVEVP